MDIIGIKYFILQNYLLIEYYSTFWYNLINGDGLPSPKWMICYLIRISIRIDVALFLRVFFIAFKQDVYNQRYELK